MDLFPSRRTRPRARDPLSAVSEEEYARTVKGWATFGGYCGYHVRYSEAVVEGVHTMRQTGHSDAHGMYDWLFARPGSPLVIAELKGPSGRVRPDQERWGNLLRQTEGTPLVLVSRPTDSAELRQILTNRR
jgi:hypothetical protein